MMIQNIDAFLIAITILTLTPGLDTALVIRNTTHSGVKVGMITSLGICCGLFFHAVLSALGVATLIAQSAWLFYALKTVGALYLIYLGMSGLISVYRSKQQRKSTANEEVGNTEISKTMTSNSKNEELAPSISMTPNITAIKAFQQGLLSNVLNPKTAVFYLAFLPQFMTLTASPVYQSLFMASIHFIIAMLWQGGIAIALNKTKDLMNSKRFHDGMEVITGMVLVLLAIKLMFEESGITTMTSIG
ncbi:LysE family translocator [Vibrio sp.]|nr:LysE family translocator [Vibrio sp.]